MSPALRFTEFTVRVDDRVVFTADDEVRAGSVVALTGTDGSEVSAVLAAIAHAAAPQHRFLEVPAAVRTEGTAQLVDDPDGRVPLAAMSRDHALLGALTATENVALGCIAAGVDADPDRLDAALDAVGVPEAVRHNLAEQLSGGQQQRVALARALVVDAALTVLDDPTSELDPASVRTVESALAAAADRGGIVLVGRSDDAGVTSGTARLRVGRRGRHAS